jgi:hypothetical protein
MGLDAVELILAVEDGFQIHIEDAEAGRVVTVGDLYQLVVSKLSSGTSKRCLTSAVFYRTRRRIVSVLGVDRREIRPCTSLEALLPEASRRNLWFALEEAMGLRLPALEHPGSTVTTFMMTGILLGILRSMVPCRGRRSCILWPRGADTRRISVAPSSRACGFNSESQDDGRRPRERCSCTEPCSTMRLNAT